MLCASAAREVVLNVGKLLTLLALAVVLLVAAGLRLSGLPDPPPGLHYDEAANIVMTRDIAYRGARPVHIEAFEGREVFYFYLSALMMRLVGDGELALRLVAGLCALVAVAATVPAARHWLGDWAMAALAAGLLAVSFWNVLHSRQALESITVATAQAVTLALWGWGLRRARWRWVMAAAGMWAGLTQYTYYSARAFPVVLAAGWGFLLLVAGRGERRLRLRQLVVFAVAAGLTVAPLGAYFVTHPDKALGRIAQLGPEGTVGMPVSISEAIRLTVGMFFVEGDPQVRWNVPGRPIFDPVTGALMMIGLGASLWRATRPGDPVTRAGHVLLAVNLVVMSLPGALAVRGVPPSFVRGVGLIPLLFVLPAVGARTLMRVLPRGQRQAALWAAVGVIVVVGGLSTWVAYFDEWAPRADVYSVLEGDMEAAGRWLNDAARPDEELYFSSKFYQHPTLAATARDYGRVRWLMAGDVLILPEPEKEALYVFPRSAPADNWRDILATATEGRVDEVPLAPDGGPAFEAFRFAAGQLPRPEPAIEVEADFAGVVALRGADTHPPGRGQAGATLYWEVLATPHQDLRLVLEVRDAWGLPWGKGHVFVGDARLWRPGEWLATRVHVPVAPGTPPLEDYVLRAGWSAADSGATLPVVDGQGRYVSTAAQVRGVAVGRRSMGLEELPIAGSRPMDVAEGVRLLGWNREVNVARPGDPLFLTLYWQAGEGGAGEDVRVCIRAVGDGGEGLLLWEGMPAHNTYPSREWLPNEVVADRYERTLPHDMAPGMYALTLSVGEVEIDLGPLEVQEVVRVFTAPPVEERVEAVFGEAIRLVGFNLEGREVRPGDTVTVELVWQCAQPMEESYTVFVHLYNPDGTIRAQQDNPPMGGTYPTHLWVEGEMVVDRYTLTVGQDSPPGEYTLGVGLYLQEGGVRLPVGEADWAPLGAVRVSQ